MNTLSIPVVVMASISFYVGFYHLLIYIRCWQYREDLTFAFLCFAYAFYAAFCVGLYNATTVVEGTLLQRAQFVALAILVPAFLWFVNDYTRQKPETVIYVYSIFYLLAIFIQLVDQNYTEAGSGSRVQRSCRRKRGRGPRSISLWQLRAAEILYEPIIL